MTIRVGIPNKGRLNERAVELLVKAGIDIGEDWGRRLNVFAKDQDLEILFVRAHDIPAFINAGAIDMGITGEDMVAESGYDLKKIADLEFGKCRLSIAAPEKADLKNENDIPEGSRIATSFPNITKAYFERIGKKVQIVEVTGAAEIMPYLGVADMISDLVATGSTLKINRLVEVCTLIESQAAVFSSESSYKKNKERIDDIVGAMISVIEAEDKKYLMANVPRTKLDDAKKILPGINGATIIDIDNDMVALQAVVPNRDMFKIINSLKKLGATGILTVPIDRLVE